MWENPVRQHTVPCSYLQWFTHDPDKKRKANITVYDFLRKKSYNSLVDNVSIKSDFYTLEDKDWNKLYDIEKNLGHNVEWIVHIIEKINSKEQISSHEAEQLSIFIWFQEFRTKYRFDWHNQTETMFMQKMMQMSFSDIKTAQQTINAIERDTWKKFWRTAEEAVEELWQNYKVENHMWWIKQMIELFKILAERIVTTKWIIFFDPNWWFITSDHPLYLIKPDRTPDHIHAGIYTAGIWFPLSKYCYLNCPYEMINSYAPDATEDRIVYQEVDKNMVRCCNHYSVRSVSERAFAKDQATLQDIINIDSWDTSPAEIEAWLNSCT